MKFFAKLMIAVLFIALMLPFTILRGPDGDTLMSFSDLKLPDFSMPEMPDTNKITAPLGGDGGKDIVYKWHDAEGNLHFTTDPPTDGTEYSVMGFDPNTNVIQAVKMPEEEPEEEKEVAAEEENSNPLGNPYDPSEIKELIEDAKDVQKMLQQRVKDQDAIMNQY